MLVPRRSGSLAFACAVSRVALASVALLYERAERVSAGLTKAGRRTPTARVNFVFGYMNRNWEEELDVPVGPDNNFEPGAARSGPADALPSAPQPLRVPVQVPKASAKRKWSGR